MANSATVHKIGNKKDKVSNGYYVWISYFYGYLSEKGRAGFVMSSQASSAGRDEAKVRRKLVATGDVDVMIAVRSNFFYTRTVPCANGSVSQGGAARLSPLPWETDLGQDAGSEEKPWGSDALPCQRQCTMGRVRS